MDASNYVVTEFNLPSNCILRINSFLTYHKVSQLRQVSKAFNDVGKKLLNEKQREVEFVLKTEMARVETRSLFSINARTSEDMLRFLTTLHEAFENCGITYSVYTDCFVAGKLLDQVHGLLKDCNSVTVLPYVLEKGVYDRKPHPLFGSIIDHFDDACHHFETKILGKFIHRDFNAFNARCRLNDLEVEKLREQNKMKILKTELLKNWSQKIDCGDQMKEEFLKVIAKLNDDVLDLTLKAKKVDEEVERVINGKDLSDNNCLFLYSFFPSGSSLGGTKVRRVPDRKEINLTKLSSSSIQNIVSYFNCHQMAQMRSLCTSFNETCKRGLNREFEQVKRKVQFQIKYNEQCDMMCKIRILETDTLQDLKEFLQLCEDNYKFHLGAEYVFIAGKVVDEANSILNRKKYQDDPHLFSGLDRRYKFRPHCSLHCLMDLVYKAVAQFKFNIVPKIPSTRNKTYFPDYIMSGEATYFEEEKRSNLEDKIKSIKEMEVKIKNRNDRNRKSLMIVSTLKKKILILNKNISEKMNVLQTTGIK